MATATGSPSPPIGSPACFKLPGVSLFASGEYRGKPWPVADLQRMASNAKKLGPQGMKLLVPPAVLGHEEEQEWLERTDLPAAGWIDPNSVHVIPDPDHPGHAVLKGDVVNVPLEVAERITKGEFRFGSAEIYDSFKDDFGRSYGKTLRRFALLGGEVPQVKRLGSLPMPVPMARPMTFAERQGRVIHERRVRHGSTIYTYAETTVMDRASMIAALQAAMPGVSQSLLDSLSDEQLAELVKNAPAAAPTMPDASAMPPVAPSGMMADMPREELIAALTDLGEDPAELEGMEDDELQALYDELAGDEEAPAEPTDAPVEPDADDAEEMAEGDPPADAPAAPADPATMTREDLIAQLTAMGQDAMALEGMTDDDLRALFTQLSAASQAPPSPEAPVEAMSGSGVGGIGTGMKPPNPGATEKIAARKAAYAKANSNGQNLKLTFASERQGRKMLAGVRRLNAFAEREYARLRRMSHAAKRREAEQFCDQLVREGKATPAQVQVLHMPLLLQLDNTASVHQFSDGKVTRRETAFERKKRELVALSPVVKFGERIGKGNSLATTSKDAAVEKARRFAEDNPNLLRASGKTPKQFVQVFSENFDADPEGALRALPEQYRA